MRHRNTWDSPATNATDKPGSFRTNPMRTRLNLKPSASGEDEASHADQADYASKHDQRPPRFFVRRIQVTSQSSRLRPRHARPSFFGRPTVRVVQASVTVKWLNVRTISPWCGQSSSEDDLRPPTGLKAPGKRLWASVAGPYVLTPAELAMLGEACRTADELDRLERAVRALPELTTIGSTGQLRPHPLLEEVRPAPSAVGAPHNGSEPS